MNTQTTLNKFITDPVPLFGSVAQTNIGVVKQAGCF